MLTTALNNYNAVLILTIMSFWHSAYYGLVVSKEDNYNDVAILTICPFGTVHVPYQACMPQLQ